MLVVERLKGQEEQKGQNEGQVEKLDKIVYY